MSVGGEMTLMGGDGVGDDVKLLDDPVDFIDLGKEFVRGRARLEVDEEFEAVSEMTVFRLEIVGLPEGVDARLRGLASAELVEAVVVLRGSLDFIEEERVVDAVVVTGGRVVVVVLRVRNVDSRGTGIEDGLVREEMLDDKDPYEDVLLMEEVDEEIFGLDSTRLIGGFGGVPVPVM
ncbi:unnamed protein product [Aphanomyces euteiches]